MSRRPVRRRVEELLWRTVEIHTVLPYVSVHSDTRRCEEPRLESSSWLEIRGYLDDPVQDVFDITFQVQPNETLTVGPARPVHVGAIIGVRDRVSVVIDLLPVDFDRLWGFAISGHLKFASLTFAPPRYGTALVVNTTFSIAREE